jgi:acyl transferase domain-containing protein/acyl carrier protein/NAD(P)-dependent dehydrogenase (short-subunit alcohol dehydrogenase family)
VLASQPDLARFIVEAELTVLNLPAGYWHQWAWQLREIGLPRHLRLVVAGSERVYPDALAAWRSGGGDRVRWLNAYGVTEAAITSLLHGGGSPEGARSVPVGRPLDNVLAHVLDAALAPVAVGVTGELYLAGDGVARGYAGRPDLTAERFLPDPFPAFSEDTEPGARLYRTGDLARRLPDGAIEVLGRADQQLKVRGFRIEAGEIEALLAIHPAVGEAVVGAVASGGLAPRLTAWLVPADPGLAAAGADPEVREALLASLRAALRAQLPEYMVPGVWVLAPEFPRLPSGKVDRRSVERLRPAPETRARVLREPRGVVARAISAAWREVLQVPAVGSEDNFFDLGGHSLLLLQVQAKLLESLGREVPVVDLFRYPTVSALAAWLAPDEREESDEPAPAAALARPARAPRRETGDRRVAIVGMAGRFPGASTVEELWTNLCAGVESILPVPDDELEETDPALLGDPRFVRAAAAMEGADRFDADFFGFTPRDAEITDPQHRIFLECSWEAIESAGYDPVSCPDRIGVFAGVSFGTYLWNLISNPEVLRSAGPYKLGISTDKDHVTTTTSYKMNLRGPSVSVQTACSTSLVAVHMACRSLLLGECEMALAGGSSITVRQRAGYLYQEGGIQSPDGHCRAFDANAQGTVRGNGVGVVLLKRLEDALADGDPVHAVILGSAVNNDGSLKVGYTAPSVEGQALVIGAALADSGVEARTITYVEAHGTGTPLGDPIEVAALTQAFATAGAADRGFCALGSIKTNLGHLDAAAGVAGLIKAALAAERGLLPPSLHFEAPNPAIDFAASPFQVNARLVPWQPRSAAEHSLPRRAGVSSFGIGGTNAHVILEEPPAIDRGGPAGGSAGRPALLVLSARTPEALAQVAERLRRHLEERPDLDLADVAWTLQAGRRAFPHRRALVCRDIPDAVAALASGGGVSGRAQEEPGVAFLFPGQGAQYPGMGLDLYRSEPVFREQVDRACGLLRPGLGLDPREILFPSGIDPAAAARRLEDTALAQPLLFLVEHALARLWMSWGVRPAALLGHSLGEYVAACLAGVFSLEEALDLVAARGRLIAGLADTPQGEHPGAMASLPLPEADVLPRLTRGLALAAVNGPSQCVVSGPAGEVRDLLAELAREGVEARRLHTSHAFHSELMDPVLEAYAAVVGKVRLSPPRLPCIANLTGTWLTAEQATDPAYWVRHLRETVRFGDGLATLVSGGADGRAPAPAALLEVGPGRTLTALARRHPAARDLLALPSLRHPEDDPGRGEPIRTSLGHLWTAGAAVDWAGFQAGERRRRVRLPTYPFERKRYWVDLPRAGAAEARRAPAARRDLADWFHVPYWRPAPRTIPAAAGDERSGPWLVFLDGAGVGERLLERWRRGGSPPFEAVTVRPGDGLARRGERDWVIDPRRRQDYDILLEQIGGLPARVVHLWSVAPPAGADGWPARRERLSAAQDLGLYSVLSLSQALAERIRSERVEITVLTSNALHVTGAEALCPERATVLGVCQTISSEHPGLGCHLLDLELPLPRGARAEALLDRIAAEVRAPQAGVPAAAFRGAERWAQDFAPAHLEGVPPGHGPFRERGTYLLTGGLGGIALEIAEHLAAKARARLVLVGRSELPPEEEWDRWADPEPREVPGEVARSGMDAGWLTRRESELCRSLGVDLEGSAEADRALDAFCAARLLRFFAASGIETAGGARHGRDEICERLRVLPKFRKFVDFMVETLAADGLARLDGDAVVFPGAPGAAPDPEALAGAAATRHPRLRSVLRVVDRCAARYGPALSGEVEAVGVLFSVIGEAAREEHEGVAPSRPYTVLAGEIAARLAALPRGRRLRVLEFGGGQGTLTRDVLPSLIGRDVEYWFTDVGQTFLVRAEAEAAKQGLTFVRCARLDVSRDPVAQGFALESFDLLLGFDVVHATPDVGQSLENLRRLLRPGGTLCLIESVERERWVDMVWGLAEGWWYFADAYRNGSPLLGLATWREVLARTGFSVAASLPEDGATARSAFGLLLATRPGAERAPADGVGGKIARVRRLRELGAEVMVAAADVTDLAAMRSVASRAVERFGRIDGVIHSAGLPGGGLLALRTREALAGEMKAKLEGTLVVGEICRELEPSFLALCSSQNSFVGQLGQAGYAAANNFVDAWAHWHAAEAGIPTVTLNWDRWQGVGMAVAVERQHRALTGEELAGGMAAADGVEAFERALASGLPQVVVSQVDFAAWLEQVRSIDPAAALSRLESSAPAAPSHARTLETEYVPPGDELEEQIAQIWQEVFGIERVGIHDDFFALGGDSLVALQMVSRIGKTFGVELKVGRLFDTPTIAGLAVTLEEAMLAAAAPDELERALDRMEASP